MLKTNARIALAASCLALSTVASAQSLQVHVLDRCPVTTPAAAPADAQQSPAIVGLILQQVISKGVDIAASALNAAAKDQVTTLTGASTAANYYVVSDKASLDRNAKVQCIVLLTPSYDTRVDASSEWLKRVTGGTNPLGITATPNFYMEIGLEYLEGNLGLKATPHFIYVGKSLAEKDSWFRKQGKDYVVAVSLNAEESGTSFGALSFAFKNIDTGTAYAKDPPDGLRPAPPSRPDWPIAARLPKLPETDQVKEAVAARKTTIASYVEANSILKRAVTAAPVIKQPIETDDTYRSAVSRLCQQVSVAKTSAAPKGEKAEAGAKFSDPRCPMPLWDAKLTVDKTLVDRMRVLDLDWAKAFYARYCTKSFKVNKAKDDVGEYSSCNYPAENTGVQVGGFYAAATVVETSEASAFLKSLASAFSEDKEKLKTALNDKLNPVRRDELSAEATISDRDARQKYQLALLKVSQLDAALQEASGGTLSSRKLIEIQFTQSKIDANAAARAAGTVVPFPDVD